MNQMTVIEHVEINQASLSLSFCDGMPHLSCIRLTPEGQLDHDVELVVLDIPDVKVAAQCYVELEAQLKAADQYGYRAKSRLLKSTIRDYFRRAGLPIPC